MASTPNAPLPLLPSSLTVMVNGSECIIAGKPNKAGTRVWYDGSTVIKETVTEEVAISVLQALNVSYEGTTLKAGEVHKSEPRLYKAGSPKAGQVIPNTGGNWTVTHTCPVALNEIRTGEEFSFTLMVTVTYKAEKGFIVSIKAIPKAEARERTNTLVTSLSFAGASA